MDSTDHPSAAPEVPAPTASTPESRRSVYDRLRECIADWRTRARGRRLLAQLDDHMLRDIGIDRARVWQETEKWFWQP
jgi:uncharacterized protein YjiS (DUF1127 family)